MSSTVAAGGGAGVVGEGEEDEDDVPPDDPDPPPDDPDDEDEDEPGAGAEAGAGVCVSWALLAEALPPHDVIISVEKLKTIARPTADKNLRNRLLLGDFANQCVNLKDTRAFASQEKT